MTSSRMDMIAGAKQPALIPDPTVFFRVLTFAAAAQVTSEQWVLLDLDRGVLNHSLLLYLRAEREEKMGGSGAKFNG